MEPVRLNKYLSDKGICSRREADRLIETGRVKINGAPAAVGQRFSESDEVTVSGVSAPKEAPKKVILAVNKPVGVVCTTRTFPGEKNIVDMVSYETRLYPVGRLDKDSKGLIFLTNDGKFAQEVTKASGNHEKEYEVVVNKEITEDFLKKMSRGVYLADLDRRTSRCKVVKTGEKKFRIVLTQGLNRQIRRMCENLGFDVMSLRRVRIMNVELGDLKEGEFREVKGKELSLLLHSVK